MTIRISPDFSAFIVVDGEKVTRVVSLDLSREAPAPKQAVFPALVADPGFRLFSKED
jgi:hypothetical protein